MSDKKKLDEILEQLIKLEGTWKGSGSGNYPTIAQFKYEEVLKFKFDFSYPIIFYEQKTVLVPENKPSHWETGFIMPLEDGSIEMSNAQGGSRTEILSGQIENNPQENSITLEFNSVSTAHDKRIFKTKRIFLLSGETLIYKTFMSTHTTETPQMLQHLEATLEKV